MRFRQYPKIPIHRSTPPRVMGGPWVALEKLHGAHLVVATDGDKVRVGKRKAWLSPEDSFFGWQLLQAEIADKVLTIARAADAAQVFVYGELIGGAYPHPETAPMPGLSPVQTGIWYTPGLAWVAFDVLIAAAEADNGEFLAHCDVESLTQTAGLLTPPRLARGTRADLDQIEVRFETRVPAWWSLPTIAGNFAEGFVLKPDVRIGAMERPVIKRKLPEFDDSRFNEAEPWNPGYLGVDDLLHWVDRLVQPARLASARSKVGIDPAAIVDEVGIDVAIDLELTFRDAWERLPAEDQERVLSHAQDLARMRLGGSIPTDLT
jgi:Rnl2 family RNA ligase